MTDYFVKVPDKDNMKRGFNDMTNSFISLLKKYESINSIRTQKIMTAAKLHKHFEELEQLFERFKTAVPSVSVPKVQVAKKPSTQEIVFIERELQEIEKRLAGLQ